MAPGSRSRSTCPKDITYRLGQLAITNLVAAQIPDLLAFESELRQQLMARHRITTTLGYGLRFLYSTGQLHKGGTKSGLYLQLIMAHSDDFPIPA